MTAKSLCLTQVLFGTGFLIVFFKNNFSLFKKTSSCVFRRAGHLYTLEFLVSSHWSFWFDHSTLLINYALLMLPKKRWWGQRVLFMRAIFRICGNESQPGLQIIQSWLRTFCMAHLEAFANSCCTIPVIWGRGWKMGALKIYSINVSALAQKHMRQKKSFHREPDSSL